MTIGQKLKMFFKPHGAAEEEQGVLRKISFRTGKDSTGFLQGFIDTTVKVTGRSNNMCPVFCVHLWECGVTQQTLV